MMPNTLENENKRSVIGYLMVGFIGLIVVRVLVDLVIGLIETYKLIKKYCFGKNQVGQDQKARSDRIKAKTGKKGKRGKKGKKRIAERNEIES